MLIQQYHIKILPLRRITNRILSLIDISNPKKILLVDACGALLTSINLGLVLPHFQEHIGLDLQVLYLLASIAIGISLFSFYSYSKFPLEWRNHLKLIAYLNMSYCILTILFLVFCRSELTLIGIGYFTLELIIITTLVIWELKIVNTKDLHLRKKV